MKRFISALTLALLMVACNNAEKNTTETDSASNPVIVDTAPVAPATGAIDNSATRLDTARGKVNRAIKK